MFFIPTLLVWLVAIVWAAGDAHGGQERGKQQHLVGTTLSVNLGYSDWLDCVGLAACTCSATSRSSLLRLSAQGVQAFVLSELKFIHPS